MSTATNSHIFSVHVGPIAPLGPKGVPSAFVKQRVEGPVPVNTLGLAGDEQADLSVHGGPEKAVYGYGIANYALWQREFPQHAAKFVPGGVGENLAIQGLTETDVFLGDTVAIGSAVLQVCQPRQPCFKFALRFEDNQLPRAMVLNGRSGWYYRVLQRGTITSGDAIEVLERPNPTWPISRFAARLTHQQFSPEEIQELANLSGLASAWRSQFRSQGQP